MANGFNVSWPALHASGLVNFQGCKRSNYFGDKAWGLGYSSGRTNPRIELGNWGHFCLAKVVMGTPYPDAIEETIARQEQMDIDSGHYYAVDRADEYEKFRHLMQAHRLWQAEDKGTYSDRNLEWVVAERRFETRIAGIPVHGQWDGIVRHKMTGHLYVFERKFVGKPDQVREGVKWDWQPRIYAPVAEHILGEPVDGVIYEIVKNCDPYRVKMLQKGLPSTAKKELEGTSYGAYLDILEQAIIDTGQDRDTVMAAYADKLAYLKANMNSIFTRSLLPISEALKASTMAHLMVIAREYQLARDNPFVVPTLNRYKCPFCPFKNVCLTMDEGQDWAEMLEASFIQGQARFDDALDTSGEESED